MIKADQPTIFKNKIIAAVSSKEDGTMKINGSPEEMHKTIHKYREIFLHKVAISPDQTILVQINYDTDHFARYDTVNNASSSEPNLIDNHHPNDALATQAKGTALFLPLADCAGAILYDQKNEALMVSHLGRHSTEIEGANQSVQYMQKNFHSNPQDILVWLSPAAGSVQYPLHAFENKSLHEVNKKHLVESGILSQNIEISNIDTTSDVNYHSHSEFLKGKQDESGRFAIVAMMPK